MDQFESEKRLLLDSLQERGYLTRKTRRAMQAIPREQFIPRAFREQAYEDHPIDIGEGQTISAPHMYAIMTAAAGIESKKAYNILEVGTGSGYQSAILAEILRIHGGGRVHTFERVPLLARRSRALLNRLGYGDVVTVHAGDASDGYPRAAPYDRILVTAGAPEIPHELFDQLVEGGIMVIPAGKRMQHLYRVTKRGGKQVTEDLGAVAFVPLVGRKGWTP